MNVTCPHCQALLSVDPSQAGEVTTCPECGGRFQIPVPAAHAGPGSHYTTSALPPHVQAFASKKIAAGICGIVLGGLGIHKFILGLNTSGIIMLVLSIAGVVTAPCLVFPIFATIAMNVIGIVEGIIYLTKTDEDFYQTYAIQKKDWF